MKQFLFSMCSFFALAFLFPLFLQAQITKAVGGNYITLMGVPENQVITQANTYKDQGYMPIFVDVTTFEGKPLQGSSRVNYTTLATMIFKKNPSRINVQLAKYNSSNAFSTELASLKAQGWYVSNVDAYLSNNKESYLAIWVKGNSPLWGVQIDAGLNQYNIASTQATNQGLRMINRVFHNQPSSGDEVVDILHATSLFTKQGNPVQFSDQLSYAQYAKMCMDMKAQNYVLTFLDIYKGRYSPIFTKNPGFTPLSAFPAHGQNALTVKQTIEQKSQEGYYPLFVICDSAPQQDSYPKYAVWMVKAN